MWNVRDLRKLILNAKDPFEEEMCLKIGTRNIAFFERLNFDLEIIRNSSYAPILEYLEENNYYLGRYRPVREFQSNFLNNYTDHNLRYCPICMSMGHHYTYFQTKSVKNCLIHNEKLHSVCPTCKKPIPYIINNYNIKAINKLSIDSMEECTNICLNCFGPLSNVKNIKNPSSFEDRIASKTTSFFIHNILLLDNELVIDKSSSWAVNSYFSKVGSNIIYFNVKTGRNKFSARLNESQYIDINDCYWKIYKSVCRFIRKQIINKKHQRYLHNITTWGTEEIILEPFSYVYFRCIVEKKDRFYRIDKKPENWPPEEIDEGSYIPDKNCIGYIYSIQKQFVEGDIDYNTAQLTINNVLAWAFLKLYKRCQSYVQKENRILVYFDDLTKELGRPVYLLKKSPKGNFDTVVYSPNLDQLE